MELRTLSSEPTFSMETGLLTPSRLRGATINCKDPAQFAEECKWETILKMCRQEDCNLTYRHFSLGRCLKHHLCPGLIAAGLRATREVNAVMFNTPRICLKQALKAGIYTASHA